MSDLFQKKIRLLKQTFIALLDNYTNNDVLKKELWHEVAKNYSSSNRYYHTLEHLENSLFQLAKVKDEIENWDAVLFTLFYHDIIYDSLKSDNEEQSAQLAEKRMKEISVAKNTIALCVNQILATKSHLASSNNDINYFIDADLSILDQPWETYFDYCQNVRKEYASYPDLVYNPGRQKVLNHFLQMARIFKTDFFHGLYENQAKQNLRMEIGYLNY